MLFAKADSSHCKNWRLDETKNESVSKVLEIGKLVKINVRKLMGPSSKEYFDYCPFHNPVDRCLYTIQCIFLDLLK